jgi:unspecific monooxygenase
VLLLNAGHEATVNATGNGVWALLRHPEQHARLRADPAALLAPAVEEMLRYDCATPMFERWVLNDVTIGDGTAGTEAVEVARGAELALLLGSANRDPAVFADPDRFDVSRSPNPHLTFGAGIHFCLGAPLARPEAQVALPALYARFPELEVDGPLERRNSLTLRGYLAIPVSTGA